MSPEIRELDDRTIDRIAAGEVVERPASVVKELVENSIDAGASRVSIEVRSGGKEGIAVRDDGVGMTEQEARVAVQEHTTSKITGFEDLESGVGTLGFRGEALHAIGAISRLTIRTRQQGASRGTELVVQGGDVVSVEPVGCPEGTSVEVDDLFFNVPARRKYLAQDATEFSHVNSIVTGYALSEPTVAISLEHGGRDVFATAGQGDLRHALMAVYGREVAAAMIPIETDPDDLPDGPLAGVSGLVSHPETTRSSREYLNTFINGRYVHSGAVRKAIVDAYGGQLSSDRYPFAAISLELPADKVDINVHPRKLEIRFADEDGLREQVRTAVRNALLSEGLIRSTAPRGRSAPDEVEILPEGVSGGEDRRSDVTDTDKTDHPPRQRTSDQSVRSAGDTPVARGPQPDPETGPTSGESETSTSGDQNRHRKFRESPHQATLDGETALQEDDLSLDRLPPMRVLGQFRDTYILTETEDGLVLVDQHAADERVTYEYLREQFAEEVTSQTLAEPVDLELTAGEAMVLESHSDALASLGFRIIREGDRHIRVVAVPVAVAEDAGAALARDLLAEFAMGDPDGTVEAIADDLLADMACYPAVTANTSLAEGSVVDLLSALDGCENPYACPHGRPVLVEFADREIEDRFERDYPGHDHRRES